MKASHGSPLSLCDFSSRSEIRDDVCLTDSTKTWPALRNILDVFLSKKPYKCRASVGPLYALGKIQPCATCITLGTGRLPERK